MEEFESLFVAFHLASVSNTSKNHLKYAVTLLVGTMKLVRRLVLTKNTPMILKAKFDIRLKVIMSPFISRLLLGQKSVASYWKMGR